MDILHDGSTCPVLAEKPRWQPWRAAKTVARQAGIPASPVSGRLIVIADVLTGASRGQKED